MLIYEINKDIYSINGDQADGIVTLPVKFGIPATRKVIIGLITIAITSLIYFCYSDLHEPLIVWIYFCCSFDYTILVLRLCGIEE